MVMAWGNCDLESENQKIDYHYELPVLLVYARPVLLKLSAELEHDKTRLDHMHVELQVALPPQMLVYTM